MKAAVVVFPGSNCDTDCFSALHDVMKQQVEYVWHKERSLPKVDLVVLPGGFSYGDYLRTGAVARFSPAMEAVKKHAAEGRYVIGICNGFQILLEAGLLPGAMLRNRSLSFICKHVWLRAEETNTAFTKKIKKGETLQIPIAHGEGNYYCDDETLKRLQNESRIIFRYSSEKGEVSDAFNPNGSRDNIAGIINEKRNVLGMMPHPERASETILSSVDGRKIWESLIFYDYDT
ncbi:MAG: phosphoribosylformylglycinamidine synthase subunit PurQ [Candidatus Omnitrophica bacterium]|nr:phosphoribosylformylglycinamidine synthase subunit PurQ [Candidatus Omnitrophota bacterium]